MATKSPRPSRQKRAPVSRRRKATRAVSKSARAQRASSAPRRTPAKRARTAMAKSSRRKVLVSDVREELARLSKRWKNILPQLRQANGVARA